MWRRFLAALFDLMLLAFLSTGLSFFIPGATGDPSASGLLSSLQLCLWFAYFVGLDYYYGGTLGKRMLGLRVALPHTDTQEILLFLLLRSLMRLVSLLLSIPYGLFVIWHPTGRTLTDFVSQGWVIDFDTQSPPKRASLPGRILATFLLLFSPVLALMFLMFAFVSVFLVIWLWMAKSVPL